MQSLSSDGYKPPTMWEALVRYCDDGRYGIDSAVGRPL